VTQGTERTKAPGGSEGAARRRSKDDYAARQVAHRTLLSIPAVARQLDVSRFTVYRLIEAGELTPIVISERSSRIRQSDIDSYVERQAAHAAGRAKLEALLDNEAAS
jgi:excisionase family DNA binding protein